MISCEVKKEINFISNRVIGAAIEVHRNLGPGLLESAYEECICREFELRGIIYERQKSIPLLYKGSKLDIGYCADLMVEEKIIVELKTVDFILPIHEAQLITYLRLADLWLGLLINFNVPILKKGIKRIVKGF